MNELNGILLLLLIVSFLMALFYWNLYKQNEESKDYWYDEYLKIKKDLNSVLKSSNSENKIS
jgi:competence protein ComGC